MGTKNATIYIIHLKKRYIILYVPTMYYYLYYLLLKFSLSSY